MNSFTFKIPKRYKDELRFWLKYLNLRGLIFAVIGCILGALVGFWLWPIHYKLGILAGLLVALVISLSGIIVLPESFDMYGYKQPLVVIVVYALIHLMTRSVYVADLYQEERL